MFYFYILYTLFCSIMWHHSRKCCTAIQFSWNVHSKRWLLFCSMSKQKMFESNECNIGRDQFNLILDFTIVNVKWSWFLLWRLNLHVSSLKLFGNLKHLRAQYLPQHLRHPANFCFNNNCVNISNNHLG